jgi:hypothetical protein
MPSWYSRPYSQVLADGFDFDRLQSCSVLFIVCTPVIITKPVILFDTLYDIMPKSVPDSVY